MVPFLASDFENWTWNFGSTKYIGCIRISDEDIFPANNTSGVLSFSIMLAGGINFSETKLTITNLPYQNESSVEQNPQDVYLSDYDKLVGFIKQEGTLQGDGKTYFNGYTTLQGAYTNQEGTYIKFDYAQNAAITFYRGDPSAVVSVKLTYGYANAIVDITKIKGDATDDFSWDNSPSITNARTYNAAIVNMLKKINGSYLINRVTLKNLGFESYLY